MQVRVLFPVLSEKKHGGAGFKRLDPIRIQGELPDHMPPPNILDATFGYFSLGLFEDALEEIQSLPAEAASLDSVSEMRLAIYHELRDWQAGRAFAEHLATADPANPSWWVQWAYCLRREKDIVEARGVLWQAVQIHPACGLIVYNLACYACVLGESDEAVRLLSRALALDPELRRTAVGDEDLAPIFSGGNALF